MLIGLRAIVVIGLRAVVVISLRAMVVIGLCTVVFLQVLEPPRAGEVLPKFSVYTNHFLLFL
jgi:hypothetical protein